jgi:molybdopterin-guanine dinucleotide biosynthesis protein A
MASCYGLILAGGLSSRMGTDKAQLHRNGQTMLEYSQSLLESLGLEVLISGSEKGIPDLFPELGPLAGIYTAVKHCESENLDIDAMLIIPVDMPLLTHQLLQKLVRVGGAGVATCYADCYLPLYLPVNNEVRSYLEQVFEERGDGKEVSQTSPKKSPRSIKRMLATLNANELPVEDAQALSNVNTPDEWDIAKRLINPN